MPEDRSRSEISLAKRFAFIGLVIALQAIAALFVLEIFARIFDPQGISYYPSTGAFMDTMILEEPIGYRNQPNLSGTYYKQPVDINSIGLRHREVEAAADSSRFRILMYGDSVVFGVGVSNEDTLPRQVERLLRDRVGRIEGREIEVVNMGVISYNSEQERIQFEDLGVLLEPDVNVLLFSKNDIEPKMWIFSRRSNPIVALGQKSYAVSLLFVLRRELLGLFAGPKPLIQSSSYREGHPRWEAIDESLTRINQLSKEKQSPFAVFTRSRGDEDWEMLSKLAAREGFPIRALSPFEDSRWNRLKREDFLADGGGNHANAEGLSMYAELLVEEIQRLGLLETRSARPIETRNLPPSFSNFDELPDSSNQGTASADR